MLARPKAKVAAMGQLYCRPEALQHPGVYFLNAALLWLLFSQWLYARVSGAPGAQAIALCVFLLCAAPLSALTSRAFLRRVGGWPDWHGAINNHGVWSCLNCCGVTTALALFIWLLVSQGGAAAGSTWGSVVFHVMLVLAVLLPCLATQTVMAWRLLDEPGEYARGAKWGAILWMYLFCPVIALFLVGWRAYGVFDREAWNCLLIGSGLLFVALPFIVHWWMECRDVKPAVVFDDDAEADQLL